MELKDTIELMTSADYKDRFRAEYEQTRIRYEKLGEMLYKYNCGKLEFKPACPIKVLQQQHEVMGKYLDLLEIRAEIEHIGLCYQPKEQEKPEDMDIPGCIVALVPRKTK